MINGIVDGFLFGAGGDLYEATKKWIISASFPVTIPVLIFIIIALVGISLIAYSMFLWKRQPPSKLPQMFAGMYIGRGETNKLVERLASVKDKYWNLAVSQHQAANDKPVIDAIKKVLENAAKKNEKKMNAETHNLYDKSVVLLLADTKKEPNFLKPCAGINHPPNTVQDAEKAVDLLKTHIFGARNLSENAKGLFEIGLYNLPLLNTLTIIDPNSPDAIIYLEPFVYAEDATVGNAPIFVIEKAKHPEVFKNLLASFEYAYYHRDTTPFGLKEWKKGHARSAK